MQMSPSIHRFHLAVLCLALQWPMAATVLAQELYFPPVSGDWETQDPASAGWDAAGLDHALSVAGERDSTGVVILHNGRLLAERYWDPARAPRNFQNYVVGMTPEGHSIEDVASAQKSVAAVIVGIAQEKGLLRLDDPVSKYLGGGWSKASLEQEQQITLRHLLTMSSGLESDLSYSAAAGSQWLYNTPAYHFLMRVVEAATGEDRNTVTQRWIAAPLGLSHTAWVPRPWASADIGVGLATTARELARFGLMLQASGKWQDRVIIADQDYLQAMLHPSQSLNPSYGYLWWLNGQEFALGAGARAMRTDGQLIPQAPADLVAMQGAMDRKLYLVPSLGLVVARLGATGSKDDESFNSAFWTALMTARR